MTTKRTTTAAAGHMRSALDAALLGVRGANPLVGAVLVDSSGEMIASGHHRGAGTLHAERDAILRATAERTDLSGATLYSTLEPCRHHGRQPACTEAVLEAGIGRVVYGAADPTGEAAGGGRLLAASGVEVVGQMLEPECAALNARWTLAQQQGRPFVTVHLAQSLDARIAAADGTSQWITSEASRAHTHLIRQRIDAILVGSNTALTDDPRLTARTSDGTLAASQPLRCVMGLTEITEAAADARLTQGRPEGEGWRQLRTRDPLEALRQLRATEHAGHPVRHVLVEGGQSVLSAFFAADLVDEVFVYQAPLLLGAGRNSLGDIGVATLSQAPRFALDPADGGAVRVLGDDVVTHLQPKGDTCSPES